MHFSRAQTLLFPRFYKSVSGRTKTTDRKAGHQNLIPGDSPENWDLPGGLRIGIIEIARLGLTENDIDAISRFFEMSVLAGLRTAV